jgi:Resolvase, N terminal domain
VGNDRWSKAREQASRALVALGVGVDTTTPSGELVANVMASVAQWERKAIGQRTKDALAVKRQSGVRLGRPPALSAEVRTYISVASARRTLATRDCSESERGVRRYCAWRANVVPGHSPKSLARRGKRCLGCFRDRLSAAHTYLLGGWLLHAVGHFARNLDPVLYG